MQKNQDILDNFSEKFPLLTRLYELYQQMPEISKNEENTLRKSSEITVLEILELVVIATRQAKSDKFQTLCQAARKLDTLKVFAAMANELKQIKDDKFNEIQEIQQSIGKMIGGWIKSANTANSAK